MTSWCFLRRAKEDSAGNRRIDSDPRGRRVAKGNRKRRTMKGKADRLRVGVVGAGYLGSFHAEKYASMDGVELVGVVDIDNVQASTVAERLGTRGYSRPEEIYSLVDAVSIVVPTSEHHRVARGLLSW